MGRRFCLDAQSRYRFQGFREKAIRMAGSQTDIKKARSLTRSPEFQTALLHRPLQAAIETALEQNSLFAVLFLDLDQFKRVNDSLGHTAGDELLVDVARRCALAFAQASEEANRTVHCGAVGGDEFAILLTHIQSERPSHSLVANP